MWTPFDSTVEAADCSVCRLFAAVQSKAGRPAKINRRPKTRDQSVCNSSSDVGDRSLTTGSDSFQPQTSSTPEVRKRMIDYLSSRTVVNLSKASDHNCLPERNDTRSLLHTSTPKQQTPSSTDTLTPTTGTESLLKDKQTNRECSSSAFRIKTTSPIKAVTSPTDKRRRNLLHPFGTNKTGTIKG